MSSVSSQPPRFSPPWGQRHCHPLNSKDQSRHPLLHQRDQARGYPHRQGGRSRSRGHRQGDRSRSRGRHQGDQSRGRSRRQGDRSRSRGHHQGDRSRSRGRHQGDQSRGRSCHQGDQSRGRSCHQGDRHRSRSHRQKDQGRGRSHHPASLNYPTLAGGQPDRTIHIVGNDMEQLLNILTISIQDRCNFTNYCIEELLNNIFSDGTPLMQGNVIHPLLVQALNQITFGQTQGALGFQIQQSHILRQVIAKKQAIIAHLKRDLHSVNAPSASVPSASSAIPTSSNNGSLNQAHIHGATKLGG